MSLGTVDSLRPVATLIVEWTIGSPNAFPVFTVETMFPRSRSGSIDLTAPSSGPCDRPDGGRVLGQRLVVVVAQRLVVSLLRLLGLAGLELDVAAVVVADRIPTGVLNRRQVVVGSGQPASWGGLDTLVS